MISELQNVLYITKCPYHYITHHIIVLHIVAYHDDMLLNITRQTESDL